MPNIAVVEDDEAVRDALSDLLLVLNCSYRTFARAETFLAAYEKETFDCLITDIAMPELSGLELQERLRAVGSSIPIIVITSSTDDATRKRALEGGARAVLAKPVSNDLLIHHLNEVLHWSLDPGGAKDPDDD